MNKGAGDYVIAMFLMCCATMLGVIIGYNARTIAINDKFLVDQAQRYQAEKRFFDNKLDVMIDENKKSTLTKRRPQ